MINAQDKLWLTGGLTGLGLLLWQTSSQKIKHAEASLNRTQARLQSATNELGEAAHFLGQLYVQHPEIPQGKEQLSQIILQKTRTIQSLQSQQIQKLQHITAWLREQATQLPTRNESPVMRWKTPTCMKGGKLEKPVVRVLEELIHIELDINNPLDLQALERASQRLETTINGALSRRLSGDTDASWQTRRQLAASLREVRTPLKTLTALTNQHLKISQVWNQLEACANLKNAITGMQNGLVDTIHSITRLKTIKVTAILASLVGLITSGYQIFPRTYSKKP